MHMEEVHSLYDKCVVELITVDLFVFFPHPKLTKPVSGSALAKTKIWLMLIIMAMVKANANFEYVVCCSDSLASSLFFFFFYTASVCPGIFSVSGHKVFFSPNCKSVFFLKVK